MTSKSPGESPDIDALVTAASHHIERSGDLQRRQASTVHGIWNSAPWGKIVLITLALALLLSQGLELRRELFGATQAAVELQAQSVLIAARAAIEQHRRETGELPDRVPLPALDALVTMEHNGSDYRLKIVLDGKTWDMDNYGTIKGGI
jgi:hypothetical protein